MNPPAAPVREFPVPTIDKKKRQGSTLNTGRMEAVLLFRNGPAKSYGAASFGYELRMVERNVEFLEASKKLRVFLFNTFFPSSLP